MSRFFPAMVLIILTAEMACMPANAGPADVVDASATLEASTGDETFYSFSVTVRHADEGWDHYADSFEILTPDGTVLGTRVLVHPHVNEQPFTRSLGAVAVPNSVSEVTLRAHDSIHGYGGETLKVALPER